MKKFLTAVFLLVSVSAFAQGGRLMVKNTSSCTVYFTLNLSAVSTTPTCAPGASSIIITLAPGASVLYLSTTTPGVPPNPQYFLWAKVLDGPTSCMTSSIAVGEPCSGYPASNIINVRTPACTPCAVVKAIWTAAAPAGGLSVLTFL